ncbi:hypothetical protein [Actinokineospora sp. HUAS TT18]|uniref:hypothetical protein n=1 Tax=Actinokineospora sp. HUAS TT18 TaxID=3447451 RepID=UPI003F528FE3
MSTPNTDSRREWKTLAALWGPGFLVALAAGAATAHGLFEVALAAGTPVVIAWLYPLITDGLAMVAYAATAKLDGSGRAYAWAVVVLAAGLSGLAQAVFLAGGVEVAPPALRFGVGAWPAVAAAIVAHLLFMLGHARTASTAPASTVAPSSAVEPARSTTPVQPAVQSAVQRTVQPAAEATVQLPAVAVEPARVEQPAASPRPRVQPVPVESSSSPAKDRARAAARSHHHRHGSLPTVTELVTMAQVSRGTAGTALQELRETPADLHLVDDENQLRNSS